MKIKLTQISKNCDKTIFENGVARLEITDRELRKNLADLKDIELDLVSSKKSKEISPSFIDKIASKFLSKE